MLRPVLEANGSEIPPAGCYVAAVELDEEGRVVAYQMAQNAIFLEGLWARDGPAHLLSLYRMMARYLERDLKQSRWLTMTRDDEPGRRIGSVAERLGMKKMNWNVFRRES